MVTMETKSKIKAVQTVIPMVPTNPRQFLRFSIPQNVGSSVYKTSLNLVFCYKKSSSSEGDESGSLVAGWIKESLGMALSKEPILAGRLRHKEDAAGDKCEMEIVSNDSGIRLIEARIDDVSLQEFVDLMNKDNQRDVVVFWKDIDHHEMNPQYSPLVYIQVTSFKCGGYSIGISSSLILIDPFSMMKFLKIWTNIHHHLISKSTKPPLFYRPNPEPIDPSLNQSIGPPSKRASNTQTTIFKVENNNHNENLENLAETCIHEAEKNIAKKPNRSSSKTVLYLKESTGDEIKIARLERRQVKKPLVAKNDEISLGNLEEISFSKDCKPAVYSSWWIRVDDDDEGEGVVMVVPSMDNKDGSGGFNVITTLAV